MELILNFKKIILREVLIIIPIIVLVYNFTASKLNTYAESNLASIMTLFLLFYASYICYQSRKILRFREKSLLILFFLFSLPAYIMSSFNTLESYLRYFTLISFVPIGFLSGVSWNFQFKRLEVLNKDRFLLLFIIPSIIAAYMIINNYLLSSFNDGTSRDYVFGLLYFIPFLLYFKNSIWPVLIYIVSLFICIISAKRTGLFCLISILPFLVLVRQSSKKSIGYKVVIIFFVVSFAYILYSYLPTLVPEMDYAIERLNSLDDQSNESRMTMYYNDLNEVEGADLINYLFGHGCMATVLLYGNPTHNDLLEILYDYGLIPLIFFILFIFSLLFTSFKSIKKDFVNSVILLSTLIHFFIMTLFNCMFTNHIAVFLLLFTLGFAFSNLKYQTKC